VFAGAVRLTPNNNFPANTPFRSLTFNGTGFNLIGSAVQLSGTGPVAGITNQMGTNTISLPVTVMSNPLTVASPAGTLTLAGAISNGGQLLTVGGNTVISGVISGAGGLTTAGGLLTLAAANTYTGATTVASPGTLLVNGSTAAASSVSLIFDGTL